MTGNPVAAARAVLAEFEQAMGDGGGENLHPGIWRYWCIRLAVAVEAVVTEPGPSRRGFLLGRFRPPASMPPPVAVPPAPASFPAADGGAWISSGDLFTVLAALRDAREFTDDAMRVRYSMLMHRLGDDRG